MMETIDKNASTVFNFRDRKMTILGTQHIGESFDGIFSIMNYYMPKRHILPMQAACVENFDGDVTIMFGSKRSGRTMLGMSGDLFIGDAGHCWTDSGVFNIDGEMFTKANFLNPE
jgi:phosphoenolpyruvate carboxykinase (ATP)